MHTLIFLSQDHNNSYQSFSFVGKEALFFLCFSKMSNIRVFGVERYDGLDGLGYAHGEAFVPSCGGLGWIP